MSKNKLGNVIKLMGVLSVIGVVVSKAMPHLKEAQPTLRKKMGKISSLLQELKEEVSDLAVGATEEITGKSKKTKKSKSTKKTK
ncbi:MAG: hypothetical protein QY321_02080 [Patescibacteria group bacterium]|nr:MAG: hypothetical protein QY321_02080 [Patescibacteria group bacterium]